MKNNYTNSNNKNSYSKHSIIAKIMASIFLLMAGACKKIIDIGSLQNKTQASTVFTDASTSNSAINGIYRQAKNSFQATTSIYNSLASDELTITSNLPQYDVYLKNQIPANNTSNPFSGFYKVIYSCNAAIEGLEDNSTIAEVTRNQYIGEAKFNRALCYFYLFNLYGGVPLITSTDVGISSTAPREDSSKIYDQIQTDLKDAIIKLSPDYNTGSMGRSRANKWAASALLARVYLYQRDYINAGKLASDIINSGLYNLLDNPAGIFIKDNSETILQWDNNATEGNNDLAANANQNPPSYIVTSSLLNSFEANDLRKTTWIGSKIYNNQIYYYPFKFTSTAATSAERYVVLRLSEQYLIRAEAEAMQNHLNEAIADVNYIRLRHGGLATPLPIPVDQSHCMGLILHERRVDLFTEGMHRWFDLKRLNKIDEVMQAEKPDTWTSTASLYPIPLSDLQRNPNLTQNPGY